MDGNVSAVFLSVIAEDYTWNASHLCDFSHTLVSLTLGVLRSQATLRGEMPNMALLVVLYAMQGVPLGLTLGSM